MMHEYVLDSFAILAVVYAETGANDVIAILKELKDRKVKVSMNVANLGEIYYSVAREESEADAIKAIGYVKNTGLELIPLDERLALAAGKFKANYKMSYADCIAAATARERGAILVTGDPEFYAVDKVISIKWIANPKAKKSK